MRHGDLTTVGPWASLAAALLDRAKRDASNGDLAALAWLITAGATIADAIVDGGGHTVLTFARDTLARVDNDELKAIWGV